MHRTAQQDDGLRVRGGGVNGVNELQAAGVGGGVREVEDAPGHVARDGVVGGDGDAEGLQYVCRAGKAHVTGGVRAVCGLASPDVLQALDGIKGVGEGHAIGQRSHALLEELDGGLGVGAVEAVDLAAGKTQDVQALLELADVPAVEVGKTQVECAVTQLVGLVDKCGPGGCVNDVAQREAVVQPEAGDGGCRGAPEGLLVALHVINRVTKGAEALLNVLDGGASRAFLDRFHRSLLR